MEIAWGMVGDENAREIKCELIALHWSFFFCFINNHGLLLLTCHGMESIFDDRFLV